MILAEKRERNRREALLALPAAQAHPLIEAQSPPTMAPNVLAGEGSSRYGLLILLLLHLPLHHDLNQLLLVFLLLALPLLRITGRPWSPNPPRRRRCRTRSAPFHVSVR